MKHSLALAQYPHKNRGDHTMKERFTTTWQQDMSFITQLGSHAVRTEATMDHGGTGAAPGPKSLLIAALSGCTGLDVISILKKMKVSVDEFTIDIEAQESEEHPRVYTALHLIYRFAGHELDRKKLERAVQLSQETYCPVNAMLKKAVAISYEVRIIESQLNMIGA
jgi:putative redox protein